MPDGTTSLLMQIVHMLWDGIRFIGMLFMGLIIWHNSAKATGDIPDSVIDKEQLVDGLKHAGDVAGVSVGVVAIGDAAGVINWFDLINDYLQTGIIILTFIWMIYRIKEIRANIKSREREDMLNEQK